jgi:hypothetical protein
MDNSTLWATILAGASAIVLLSNAVEKIIKAWKSAKAPHDELASQVKALQEWKTEVDKRLDRGGQHFDAIDASNRVTQLALLALLDHGIDGNNIDQMQHAKEELQTHLINR